LQVEKSYWLFQKSLTTFIAEIIASPEKYSRGNLGINYLVLNSSPIQYFFEKQFQQPSIGLSLFLLNIPLHAKLFY
jgi:hypothetical protein